MTKLSVNINKVALLRNQRDINIPSVLWSAQTVIDAGAHGVTVHPRPDERHVRYSDVYEISDLLKNHPEIEFNIEGNPFQGRYMEVVEEVRPTQATLVPDLVGAVTSDHGFDLLDGKVVEKLKPVIGKLKELNIRTSVFVDPDVKIVEAVKAISTDRIELYTEPFATAFANGENVEEMTKKYADSAELAKELGIELNAGHDLSLDNLGYFCEHVQHVQEVSIGHALIADALKYGLHETVKKYLQILV